MRRPVDCIFCITTGRSGSHYLATIFGQVAGCRALHEPAPVGNGRPMRQYAKGRPGPIQAVAREKARKIKDILEHNNLYVETNHCFIKGFGWFMPEHFTEERLGVIILKRSKPKVVASYMRVGTSPLNWMGRLWITTPEVRNPLVKPPAFILPPRATYHAARALRFAFSRVGALWGKLFRSQRGLPRWLNRYELDCLKWYVDETAAQAEAFQNRFQRIRYYEVDVESLDNLGNVHQMLEHFGCERTESLADIVGKATNLKQGRSP